jgi:hypothetical protein
MLQDIRYQSAHAWIGNEFSLSILRSLLSGKGQSENPQVNGTQLRTGHEQSVCFGRLAFLLYALRM